MLNNKQKITKISLATTVAVATGAIATNAFAGCTCTVNNAS
ncbi:hypothetical protein [Limosilactobacillus urinaemulieris]|nr:hypothetical protein [Limosilactobacillus urinaemulieris]